MDYQAATREQLMGRIAELEELNKALLDEREHQTSLDFPWTGNLGHWYWNIQSNTVVFNPLKVEALGYVRAELPESVPYQFFTDKLHPEDYPGVMEAMVRHLQGEAVVYEVEYRIQAQDGSWKWFYDRGKITQRDAAGQPLLATGIVFDITHRKAQEQELAQKNQQLQQQSYVDALTGIKNRRAIMQELEEKIDSWPGEGEPFSVGMFDIDYFKRVNDQWGHRSGDEVLKKVAQVIAATIRESDSVGRYGGEEFLVIFDRATGDHALAVAQRIRENVAASDELGGIRVTVSGGIQEYHREGIAELIDLADSRMYAAKKAGRNQVVA